MNEWIYVLTVEALVFGLLAKTVYLEGCCLSVCFLLPLVFRAGSTSFRYQMVCAIYLEIIIPHQSILMCCVIHDLEGSYDANPQDANLTLVGEICFP